MELRVLRYFVTVAQTGNITRAAQQLHLTQPTLSRQLKELEQQLGQPLYHRSNYSVILTPAGRILYQRAMDLLELADKTLAEFDAMQAFNGGDIHIGCAESEGISLLAQVFHQLQQRYPNLRIHLYSGNAQLVTERLEKGLLDFAVVVQMVDVTRFAAFPLPARDLWGLILRKDSPLVAQREIPLEQLLTLPLIVSRQGVTSEMHPWFLENYDRLHIVATYDLLYNASLLVKEGIGCALGFDKLVDTGASSLLCFRPLTPRIESPMRLIWNKTQVLSRAAALFVDTLQGKS